MFPSLSRLVCLTIFSVSIFVYLPVLTSVKWLPVCWDCKGSNDFDIVKNLFFFFLFVSRCFQQSFTASGKYKKRPYLTPFQPFKLLLLYPSHCFPSSEAECKCRKKFRLCKTICRNILFTPAKMLKYKPNYLHRFSQGFVWLVQ